MTLPFSFKTNMFWNERLLLFLETYQLSENSTYLDHIFSFQSEDSLALLLSSLPAFNSSTSADL